MRVIIAYLIVGWLLIQIADVTAEPLHLPQWSDTLVIWLVGLGFPIAIILAWVLDVTATGKEVTGSAEESTALAGDMGTALDCLERAADPGARNKQLWESDKDFENIRDQPRFRTLVERI